jgi:hypothetical protein
LQKKNAVACFKVCFKLLLCFVKPVTRLSVPDISLIGFISPPLFMLVFDSHLIADLFVLPVIVELRFFYKAEP